MSADEPSREAETPESETGEPFRVLDFRILVALGFVIIAVGAGMLVAYFGPKIWPKTPPKPVAAASAPAVPGSPTTAGDVQDPAALRARIAELERQLEQARHGSGRQGEVGETAGKPSAAIEARLDRLEQAGRRTSRAAAAAVAAGALADAAETSRPFVGELATLERLSPQTDLLTGLRPLAETGAPTRGALTAGFPEVASRAAMALHSPPKESSPLARMLAALGRLVVIRRIDDVSAQTPDAALARAERALADGDLKAALSEVDALPGAARDAIKDWREGARRRLEIERRIEALRTRALRDLAAELGTTP